MSDIKTQLEAEKDRLTAEIEELKQQDPSQDTFRDVSNTDDEDAAESEDHSRTQARLDVLQAQSQAIEKALAKIKAGTYGTCERCGKSISPDRLKAKPWAIYDIECEQIVESGRG